MVDRIRAAGPADARAVAELHVAGWRSAYQGLVAQGYLDALSVDEREPGWRQALEEGASVLVLERDGRVDGFCGFEPCQDDDIPDGVGEIYALYVRPGTWSAGIGGRLLEAAVEALRAGADDIGGGQPEVLWTMEGNARARHFYEQRGWCADGRRREEHRPSTGGVPGVSFVEVRYRRSSP